MARKKQNEKIKMIEDAFFGKFYKTAIDQLRHIAVTSMSDRARASAYAVLHDIYKTEQLLEQNDVAIKELNNKTEQLLDQKDVALAELNTAVDDLDKYIKNVYTGQSDRPISNVYRF